MGTQLSRLGSQLIIPNARNCDPSVSAGRSLPLGLSAGLSDELAGRCSVQAR